MNRKADVFLHEKLAGVLAETDAGYSFLYDLDYTNGEEVFSVSQTLPVTKKAFQSKVLFSFFDGLIPEGWLLDIAIDNWKINTRDRFGLLLACCKNTIGAVSVIPQADEEL